MKSVQGFKPTPDFRGKKKQWEGRLLVRKIQPTKLFGVYLPEVTVDQRKKSVGNENALLCEVVAKSDFQKKDGKLAVVGGQYFFNPYVGDEVRFAEGVFILYGETALLGEPVDPVS